MDTTPATIPCPICSEALRFTVTTNRNGKHAIGVHCAQDGRHFRGFINHKPFVEQALSRMAEAQEVRTEGLPAEPAGDPLQNPPKVGGKTRATKKPGRSA